MKKYFKLSLLLAGVLNSIILSSPNAIAAGSIHGQVRNQMTGRPVPYASISVRSCNTLNTLKDGAYIIDCPAGSYSLEVHAKNYQEYTSDDFVLSDNQFLKKDILLVPERSGSGQDYYAPGYQAQSYQQEEYREEYYPQGTEQNDLDHVYEAENERVYSQETTGGQGSQSAKLLGELLGKKAGDRVDRHMQKRQQRKDNVNQEGYYADDYYYTEGASDELYNPEEYYGSDGEYYFEGVNEEYYYPEENYESDEENYDYIDDDGNEVYYQGSYDENYNDSQSGTKEAQTGQSATAEQRIPSDKRPATEDDSKDSSKQVVRDNNKKQYQRSGKASLGNKKSKSVVIDNKTVVNLVAGGKSMRLTLKGKRLDLIKSISAINQKGRRDKSVIIKLGNRVSGTQRDIYLSASPNARNDSGYYRLQIHAHTRKYIVHPDKIRITVTASNRQGSRDSTGNKQYPSTLRKSQ